MNLNEIRAKVDMEYCSLCTRGFPHVAPRQYSPLEIVEDARGFVDYLKCKDIKKCAEYMSTVDWAQMELSNALRKGGE